MGDKKNYSYKLHSAMFDDAESLCNYVNGHEIRQRDIQGITTQVAMGKLITVLFYWRYEEVDNDN